MLRSLFFYDFFFFKKKCVLFFSLSDLMDWQWQNIHPIPWILALPLRSSIVIYSVWFHDDIWFLNELVSLFPCNLAEIIFRQISVPEIVIHYFSFILRKMILEILEMLEICDWNSFTILTIYHYFYDNVMCLSELYVVSKKKEKKRLCFIFNLN